MKASFEHADLRDYPVGWAPSASTKAFEAKALNPKP